MDDGRCRCRCRCRSGSCFTVPPMQRPCVSPSLASHHITSQYRQSTTRKREKKEDTCQSFETLDQRSFDGKSCLTHKPYARRTVTLTTHHIVLSQYCLSHLSSKVCCTGICLRERVTLRTAAISTISGSPQAHPGFHSQFIKR